MLRARDLVDRTTTLLKHIDIQIRRDRLSVETLWGDAGPLLRVVHLVANDPGLATFRVPAIKRAAPAKVVVLIRCGDRAVGPAPVVELYDHRQALICQFLVGFAPR